jgi:predicted esterase
MFDSGGRFLVVGLLAVGCSTSGAGSAVDSGGDRAGDTQSPGAPSDSRVDTDAPGTPADGGRDAAPPGTKADGGGGAGGPVLPVPAGACPEFIAGDVTFNPAGGARQVTITMGDAATTQRGPLIVYWYATGGSVREAAAGLPLPAIAAAGGIVVAPQDLPDAGTFPWLQNFARHDALFDEIVGCAVQKTMIDPRRIHAAGFSAGALMTTHLSYARSRLLASVATYSGGAPGQFQEPNNKFAALIFTGGPSDILIIDFFQSSQQWQTTLKNAGHFALLCNHGGGHSIPARLVPGVWQFFQDHPYGTGPSPYAGGKTPAGLAPPCVE